MSTAVDVGRIAFFVYGGGSYAADDDADGQPQMTIIDLPMNLIYGVCALGFAAAAVRSVQVAIENWRAGGVLERPEQRARAARANAIEDRERRAAQGDRERTLLTSFLALMVTGIPVAIAMAGASLIYILLSGSTPPMVVVHRMISGLDSFPLLAVPFFILAGNLMNNAGITNRIYNFALALVGWMKGGLGHVNIIGSVIFAGMSGTAIADAAGSARSRSRRCATTATRKSFRSASPRRRRRSARSFRRRCRS